MPFAKAADMLTRFTGTPLSASTALRHTETIGLAYDAVQLAEVEQIERDWPQAPPGPQKLLLSVDGAFVPLLHGEWAEVKTLAVGEVGQAHLVKGEVVVPTLKLSYFSRLSDAQTFQRLTLGELHRRGLERALEAACVGDGAEWIVGFAEYHCPEALQIVDFAHAAGRVCEIGEAVLGSGHASLAAWRERRLHQLKHGEPGELLKELKEFAKEHLEEERVAHNLAYLEKRVEQIAYRRFAEAGWPIGSGMVESANKVVVEARMKGAGMHWSRASVDGMLALRNAVCNDRWEEAWERSAERIREEGVVRREITAKQKQTAEQKAEVQQECGEVNQPAIEVAQANEEAPQEGVKRKPAADHPWRRTNYATKARMVQAAAS